MMSATLKKIHSRFRKLLRQFIFKFETYFPNSLHMGRGGAHLIFPHSPHYFWTTSRNRFNISWEPYLIKIAIIVVSGRRSSINEESLLGELLLLRMGKVEEALYCR